MSLVLQNNEAERKAADEALQKALKLLLDDSFNPQDLLQKLRAHRDCFNSDHALGSVLITINGLNNDIAHVKKDIEAARGDLKSEGLQLAQELEQAKKNLTDFNRDNPRDAKNPLSSEKNFELHWIQATLRLAELRVEQYNEWKVPLVESRIKEQEAWLAKTEERVGQLEQVRQQYQADQPNKVVANGPTKEPGSPASVFGGVPKSDREPTPAPAPAA